MDYGLDVLDSRKASIISEVVRTKVPEDAPATFEEAITATKFGKFNIILALMAMLGSVCGIFDSSSMSYTLVAAQCDLELSLNNKGVLNSFTYIGMVCSAAIWGFLFDVLGRKKLLTIGFLVDAVFVFMSSLSQNLPMLLVSKFLQGIIINGPTAALSSYMSEFHCAKYRPTFQLLIGSCMSIGMVLLPLIAWAILPQTMDFSLVQLNFHSWNVFLFVTGLPAFLSGLIFLFFPESPKFLMTCGENEKALAIFRKVYCINTGQPEDTYPIKRLVDETQINADNKHGGQITARRTTSQALKEGFQQIKPLFFAPQKSKIMLTCSIMFFSLMSLQMLRLWLPQIFQIMTDYLLAHNGTTASLCVMLETISSPNSTTEECTVEKELYLASSLFLCQTFYLPNLITALVVNVSVHNSNTNNSTVYINSAIVGTTAALACGVVGFMLRYMGKKKLLFSTQIFGSICCMSMYFATSPAIVLCCSCLFIANVVVATNIVTSVTIDLFPTTLRTLAIALGLMFGRIGAMLGNFIFPFLLLSGCAPPFFVVAAFTFMTFLLSLFLPNTDMNALS